MTMQDIPADDRVTYRELLEELLRRPSIRDGSKAMPLYVFWCRGCKKEITRDLPRREHTKNFKSFCCTAGKPVKQKYLRTFRAGRR